MAVATDTFGQRNQGVTVAESVDVFARIVRLAEGAGIRVTATLSVAFGCPYEGEVPVARVADVAAALAGGGRGRDRAGGHHRRRRAHRRGRPAGCGAATPCHCAATSTTRGTPGWRTPTPRWTRASRALDASLGGIGGCPFAPNATGNIPTEDLAYMLARMGFDTGIDLDALAAVVPWLEERLGKRGARPVVEGRPVPYSHVMLRTR